MVVAAILVATGVAYAPTINDWFTSDDFYFLRAIQASSTGAYVRAAFDFTGDSLVPFWLYRPVALLNFLWLYQAFGDHAWGYRLVALGVHMANTVLVWLIASKLTKRTSLAHVSALVFGLHPAYAPAVAWISNSMSLFALTFALGALLFHLKYAERAVAASRYQVAAFSLMVVAVFFHPETAPVNVVICVAQLISRGPAIGRLLAPRTWAPLIPYAAFSVAFLALHFYIREQELVQMTHYKWGTHLVTNFLGNVAMVGNPFGPDSNLSKLYLEGNRSWATSFADPRTLLPIIGVCFMSLTLLATELRRPGVRLLVVVWFYVSLIPISTSPILEVTARKLYVAGPAFALMLAMWLGLVLDWVQAVLPRVCSRIGVEGVRERSVPLAWIGVVLGVVVAVFFAIRITHVTSPSFIAFETHNVGMTSETEKALIDEIEVQQPDLASGSQLVLFGTPLTLRTRWGLHPRFVAAVELYHPDVFVLGVWNLEELLALPGPVPGVPRSYVFYDCGPTASPPTLAAWVDVVQQPYTCTGAASP